MDRQRALADIDTVLAGAPKGGGSAAVAHRVAHLYPCICRWAPPGSSYRELADRWRDAPIGRGSRPWPDVALRNLLETLRGDVDAGRLDTLEELVHARLFENFLDQAAYLLRQDFRRAAATVAGGVLEERVRNLCRNRSIPLRAPGGEPIKAAVLNIELKKAGAYGEATRTQVEAWLKLRNDAAHGEPTFEKTYGPSELQRMIDGVRDFVSKHSA